MAPEQRAKQAIKAAQTMLDLKRPTAESIERNFVDAIASALRDAENEALERAAAEFDKDAAEYSKAAQDGREWPRSWRLASFSRCAARTIRHLKHKSGPSADPT